MTLTELAQAHGFAARTNAFLEVARPTIRITPSDAPADDPVLARCRYGGPPDLPPDVEWPLWTNGKPLSFLGQIELADLAGSVVARELPAAGLLSVYFYLNENDYDVYSGPNYGQGNEGWRLFYFPPEVTCVPRPVPDALTWSQFQPHPLTFDERLELPRDTSGWFEPSELEGPEWDHYWDVVCAASAEDQYGDRLLGHFPSCQRGPHFEEAGRLLWSVGLIGGRLGLWGDHLTRLHISVSAFDLRAGLFGRAGLEAEWLST